MFVTVLFGDSRQELFNLNCKLLNFIYDLKERCGLDRKDCVDLMDRCGQVTSLSEKEQSAARAASLLTERHSYVLLRVCRCEESQGQKYESLLNNLSKSHPELADILNRMSNPSKERDKRGSSLRKKEASAAAAAHSKSKNISGNKKNK
ncbi:uncharacterized protein C22orf15 [Gadus macrocephalus]|uniref:uncharacterized protein C22orf15 n=1 Tax=Gadus macrocephalus TaxID=80720 RepID=UPI0028CB1F8F|nr:uncharacterized protein C22orf15 [Gadus macrocephalus]